MSDLRLYSTQEAADALGMDQGFIRRLAAKHDIGRKLGGGSWAFSERDIERLREHRWEPGKRGRPRRPAPEAGGERP